jgi:Ca2+-binding RTX toxin-like protein
LSTICKNEGLTLEFANKMDSIKEKQTKMNSNENKQKTAVVLVGAAAILAISAGFISTIGMIAWAAFVQCQPAQPCNGTAQSDAIRGTEGADKISALGGNDAVDARGSNDIVTGGSGNDLLSGGSGDDTFTSGQGAEVFSCGDGVDTIPDFNAAQGDAKTTDCENF